MVLAAAASLGERTGEVRAALRAASFIDPGERSAALRAAGEAREEVSYDTIGGVSSTQRRARAEQRLHSSERGFVHDRRIVVLHGIKRLPFPAIYCLPLDVREERADDRRVARDLRDVRATPVLGASERRNALG